MESGRWSRKGLRGTSSITGGGTGILAVVATLKVEGAEAQGDQQVENASGALTVLVVVVAIMSVICYKLVEEMVKAILQQRRRGTVEILVENREVQTTLQETEQEIRRRVWEEVRRDLRLERLQQRHREEQEMEEEDFRVESRSASQSSESSSSGVRLRQRRHDTPRPMGSIAETPMARQEEPQREPVELYHLTHMGERYHWDRECWGLRHATIRGMRSLLPCPNCWLGMRMQRDRNATAWKGEDGRLHSTPTCGPMMAHSRGMPLRPCRFCVNGVVEDPTL